MNTKVIKMIDNEQASCAVAKKGQVICSANGKGIRPLLELYINYKEKLQGSFIADKVIGKAAAIIIVSSSAKKVYGRMISKSALELLNGYSIDVQYKQEVQYIQNMNKTDMCPLEERVKDINNLEEGIHSIIQFCKEKQEKLK